jgi:hypothetical protein
VGVAELLDEEVAEGWDEVVLKNAAPLSRPFADLISLLSIFASNNETAY